MKATAIAAAIILAVACGQALAADTPARPWMDKSLSPDERARLLEQAMTPEERQTLLHGIFAVPLFGKALPEGAIGSAGYVPGIPRLGVPALQESDASLGVANPFNVRPGDGATPLPSGLSSAATWNPEIAYRGGAMIGQEAWRKGLNVLLAGGANLARDPRNGRNFEYLGEDPLLAGTLAGESIRGIQDQHVVSTTKHFALNDQESGRRDLNARIGEAALRESDLLAFELAIERGHPGSVMCAYNKVNGPHACSSEFLMTRVLKQDWAFPGWMMSDWGAVHDVKDALAGLDQESGQQFDREVYFDKPLTAAVASGAVPAARISDMARRILRSMFAVGLFDFPATKTPVDVAADEAVAREAATQGIVLLANRGGLLPLSHDIKRILVIGGHADYGVLSGGGSSQVIPNGGQSLAVPMGGDGFVGKFRVQVYDPSSPVKAIAARQAGLEVHYYDGSYPAAAAAFAKQADVAIVFATQWMIEGEDVPDLTLPNGQDALIEAVAKANPHTIVVLETGGPVLMPWLDQVGAVMEAWYPGAKGGDAIADILFGVAEPSGRLPITFPAGAAQLPRPEIPGYGLKEGAAFDVDYSEGADVGYRWFARKAAKPLFPFGFGLGYTSFDVAGLKVEGGQTIAASFEIRNTGSRAGIGVPQLYLTDKAGKPVRRLLGWERLQLAPGEAKRVTIKADPRLLADWDETAHGWRVNAGQYTVAVGGSAVDLPLSGAAAVDAGRLKP